MKYIYKKSIGKTVLFLHGWGGDKNSFSSLYNFLYSYGFSVLSVDFSGFGENEPLSREYTIYDYSNDLKNLLKELNITDFYVVCHSFGSRVFAIIDQNFNIEKSVICDGAGLKEKFSLSKSFKIFKYKFIKKMVNFFKLDKSILNKYGSSDYKNLPENMKKTFINIVNKDLTNYFKTIKGDVLIYWGKNDDITPLYMAKKLKKLIKNSNLIIENGGHFCYLENDFSFCNLVLEFFKGDLCTF